MRILMLMAFILLSVNSWAKATIGEAAPDFTLTDTYGQSVNLSDFKGKTVILEWTNHQCPYVMKHYDSGNMQATQTAQTKNGVVWLSIISSAPGKQGYVDAATANQLTDSRAANPTKVLLDPAGDVGRSYNAKTTPHMYIIDGQGILRYQGAIDSIKSTDQADIAKATNYVAQAMSELNEGKPVSTPVSKAYGCSIKYQG